MLYLISLFYNLVYHRWFHKSFWWSRIDDGIYLGAIPLDYHLEALLSLEISTVISMVEDFERLSNFLANPISKVLWRENSVENISISAVDFKPLTLGQIYLGSRSLYNARINNRHVYVHCKAGKTRSAAVVLAYLSTWGKQDFVTAYNKLVLARPIIRLSARLNTIELFYHIYSLLEKDLQSNEISKHLNFVENNLPNYLKMSLG